MCVFVCDFGHKNNMEIRNICEFARWENRKLNCLTGYSLRQMDQFIDTATRECMQHYGKYKNEPHSA